MHRLYTDLNSVSIFSSRRKIRSTKGSNAFQLQNVNQSKKKNTHSGANHQDKIQNRGSEGNVTSVVDINDYETTERRDDHSTSEKSFGELTEPDLYDHTNDADARIPDSAYDRLAADKQESVITINEGYVDYEYSTAQEASQNERFDPDKMNEYSHLNLLTDNTEERPENTVAKQQIGENAIVTKTEFNFDDETYYNMLNDETVNKIIKKNRGTAEDDYSEAEYHHLNMRK